MASVTPYWSCEPTLGVRPGAMSLIRPARLAPLLAAAGFAVVLAFSLSRSLFDPIGFDQAMYQYMTERLMAGQSEHAVFWSGNAMGIYLPHWLATVLFGTHPAALRMLDGCWQVVTFGLIVLLGARDGGRWTTGFLAAGLYAMAYYAGGYIHTAQREGFALAGLLILAHASLNLLQESTARRAARPWGAGCLAGLAAVFACTLKQPLGLCYGVVWCWLLVRAVQRRGREGSWQAWAALTGGFVIAGLAAGWVFVQLGFWHSYADVFTLGEQMPAGYVRGPMIARAMAPAACLVFVVLIAILCVTTANPSRPACTERAKGTVPFFADERRHSRLAFVLTGLTIFSVLWLNLRWEDWRQPMLAYAGLLLPAAGAILGRPWAEQTPAWRLCGLMALAALAGVALQGWFFVYHLWPVLGFAAYLTAREVADAVTTWRTSPQARAWAGVCVASVLHLLAVQWFPAMSKFSRSPSVLAGTSLAGHYQRITRHKVSYPASDTTAKAAARIQALTGPDDPIVCLFRYPQLYQAAARPPAHRLICVNEWMVFLYPEFMESIQRVAPKVAAARIPAPLRGLSDRVQLEAGLFKDLEATFGHFALFLRDQYQLSEVIDDVALLTLRGR